MADKVLAGCEAAGEIARILRLNGCKHPQLAYLVENALRKISDKRGNLRIQAGTNANPQFTYEESAANVG